MLHSKTKLLIFLGIWGILSLLTYRYTFLEKDLIKSLKDINPDREELFSKYSENSFFDGKLFIQSSKELDPITLNTIYSSGYIKDSLLNIDSLNSLSYEQIIPLISEDDQNELFSQNNIENSIKNLIDFSILPGGTSYIKYWQSDPFSVKKYLLNKILAELAPKNKNLKEPIYTFRRDSELDFEKVQSLYSHIKSISNIKAMSADFYAAENHEIIKKDLNICFGVSIILNILLFIYFCPSLIFLLFLLVGTSFSYLFGMILVNSFFPYIFTITLAFTTTFVSFNNEYLVHLSGIEGNKWKLATKGLLSAIGTTFLIFILLLFSSSILVQQIAVISLGGMIGFLALLLSYRTSLSKIKFRTLDFSFVAITRKQQTILFFLLLGLIIAIFSFLKTKTNIDEFRFQSTYLSKSSIYYESLLKNWSQKNPVAIDIKDNSINNRFLQLKNSHKISGFHPLNLIPGKESQEKNIRYFKNKLPGLVGSLRSRLEKIGLQIQILPNDKLLATNSSEFYLKIFSKVLPQKWLISTENHKYLIYNSTEKPDTKEIHLSIKNYYNQILEDASKNMILIFAICFGLISVYLFYIHKNFYSLFYILTPLLLSTVSLLIYLYIFDRSIHFIHILGFSLVLALALDYSSISISSKYSNLDQSKITFTGLSTLIAFGALSLANHPVLRDLGIVVFIGSLVALSYSLFVRLNLDEN